MANLPQTQTLDVTGIGGLVERYQGDLNSTSASPHLCYIGNEGEFAGGFFNPVKKYGYMSPANNTFTTLTGSIGAGIVSIVYEPESDIAIFAENGDEMWKLDGLDDTSLTSYTTITSGYSIKDAVLYELNNQKSLLYVVDSGLDSVGSYVGFSSFDTSEGIYPLTAHVAPLTTSVAFWNVVDAGSVSLGSLFARKLAQQFNTSDFSATSLTISGAKLMLSRELGTGSGITLKVSIQAENSSSTSPYTSRGAWATSTSYAINDTVTNGGYTWMCWAAHTSGASSEPGVGGAWEDYWNRFGAPTGTALASGTFSLSSLENLSYTDDDRITIEFSSPVTLSSATNYWLVLEEVGSVMTASDRCGWKATVNDASNYERYARAYNSTSSYWRDINFNGDTLTANHDNFDFVLISNKDEDWSLNSAQGKFDEGTGDRQFLHVSDNGLLYWVVGNRMHQIDGSFLGGEYGKIYENILRFPSYISIADIAETRSYMYFGVQSSNITSSSDVRNYAPDFCGMYVWDRHAVVVGESDYYPMPGAQEIKSVFQSFDGSVYAITIGNTGFTEIRGLSGNQYATVRTLEKDAYPVSRRGVGKMANMTVWLGRNGTFYAFGEVAPGSGVGLFKIGTMAAQANAGLTVGPILVANEYASSPRQAILFGWTDSDPSYIVQKYYPHGEGTIDSNSQLAHQGDIYSRVYYLPTLSTIRKLTFYCGPVAGTASTVIATIKLYFNQSSTVGMTKSITQAQASRGYVEFEINKHNVNAFQYEIEHNTTDAIGANTFTPSVGFLETQPTTTNTKDLG